MRLLRLLSIQLLLLSAVGAAAQDYKYEVGGGAGIGFYMGDANTSTLYKEVGWAAGAVARWNLNYRWVLKGNLSTLRIAGDTDNFDNAYPNEASYQFERQLFDLGVQMEYNFLSYGIGKSYLGTSRIAPYLVAGVGVTFAPESGNHFWSMNIPLGLGVKYKIAPRWNVGCEFTLRKTMGDSLDSTELSDPYGIESLTIKNTDWYNMTLFTVTYDIFEIIQPCNNL